MIELIEKTMLTAVGAMTLTQQKAEEMLKEMRQKFNVTEEEGKAFLEKLQKTAEENQQKLEKLAQEEVRKACDRVGVVTEDEFEKLKKDVTQLKRNLTILEKKVKGED